MIFTPDKRLPQMSGNLGFRSCQLSDLHELDVQRHSAPVLTSAIGAGGLSDVIFTPDMGAPVSADISFGAGRLASLVEQGGPEAGRATPSRYGAGAEEQRLGHLADAAELVGQPGGDGPDPVRLPPAQRRDS